MLEEIDEFIESDNITDQADAMIDLIYFALGTLVEMGVKPQKLFDIVHEANMTKLWEDGKPRYNSDGKTIKPPGWQDPFKKLEDAIGNYLADM
jgi:predicted HAD superfamily Cof-like phosphohydrolase